METASLREAHSPYAPAASIEHTLSAMPTAWREALRAVTVLEAQALCLVTPDRQVAGMNASARRIVDAGDGLALRWGELVAARSNGRRLLSEALDRCFREGHTSTLVVPRASGRHPLYLEIERIVLPVHERASLALGRIQIVDLCAEPVLSRPRLEALFEFTPRECDIAEVVGAGRSPKHAARELGISVDTVRAHLKQMFSKTGARRQSQLVRLLLLSSTS